ncbi:hypothetical protein PMAYCL1PPCAC_17756 [Pristionchus mayeri]|uniref:BTB domain-containing protein n=1 Tax=Pristionchus mayeri TaxID=1317129 RepID=A0AAN5CN77_9BILA|nr:hypothetical protein PMAYCL1PPCAC_17756 [Pristionchus mayeri]
MGNTSSVPEEEEELKKRGKGRPKKGAIGKRKRNESNDPKSAKKAKLETAKYVYDKLFVEGQDSDISIKALGYRWKLHRFYLKQCDYFSVLLDGEWKDSKIAEYTLEIPDEHVTKDGLHSVLGALYDNEIVFEVDKLRSIIAAASFLQMTEIFDKAAEAMINSIDDTTVLEFLECGYKYEIDEVTSSAFEYLRWNLWRLWKGVPFLRSLPKEALVRLLACHDLPVIEGEMDLYKAIRGVRRREDSVNHLFQWIFLHESDLYSGDDLKEMETEVNKYLKMIKSASENDVDSIVSTPSSRPSSAASSYDEVNEPFYSTSAKQPYSLFLKYSQLFAGLRLHSLCCSTTQIKIIQEDGLLPPSLIDAVLADRYIAQLAIDENRAGDGHRQSMEELTEENFLLSCTRLGRALDEIPKCWRWTGSHFGVDLLMNIQSTMLTMKRNVFTQQQQQPTYSMNVRSRITIAYRAIILAENGTIVKDTKRTTANLDRDTVVVISRFKPGELPPKFSIHLYVMFGSPSTNPSFILVRNAVNQMKKMMKPRLEMDNVSLIDNEEEQEEEEDNRSIDSEKSADSDESLV